MKELNKLFRKNLHTLSREPIFIHIPRTGGTALERSFRQAKLNINNPLHTPAKFVKNQFPTEFKNQFTFTIVRNPYERFLSACRFNGVMDEDIESFSKDLAAGNLHWCSNYSIDHYEHFFTQKHFVTDFDNTTVIVDYIGKFEELDKVLEVLKENRVDVTEFFEVRKTKSEDYKEVLTQLTKRNIEKIYKEDFELINTLK